jgi:hypothetical protein
MAIKIIKEIELSDFYLNIAFLGTRIQGIKPISFYSAEKIVNSTEWRFPSIEELKDLIDYQNSNKNKKNIRVTGAYWINSDIKLRTRAQCFQFVYEGRNLISFNIFPKLKQSSIWTLLVNSKGKEEL